MAELGFMSWEITKRVKGGVRVRMRKTTKKGKTVNIKLVRNPYRMRVKFEAKTN